MTTMMMMTARMNRKTSHRLWRRAFSWYSKKFTYIPRDANGCPVRAVVALSDDLKGNLGYFAFGFILDFQQFCLLKVKPAGKKVVRK